jgi:VanZ family protein
VIDRDNRRARWWVRALIAYWCFAFLLTHIPLGSLASAPIDGADKIVHFGLYFVLTWLGGRTVYASRGRFGLKAALLSALIFAGYGVADEWLQGFVARTPSRYDWFADLIGISAATIWNLRRLASR